jgi:hypothetical protein
MSLSGLNQTPFECCRIKGTKLRVVHGTEPAWSPDSSTLAYVAPDPKTGGDAIWLVPVDRRKRPVKLTLGHSPNWSPLGDRIAYVFQGDVHVVAARPGATPRRVDAAPRHVVDANPAWSPDTYTFGGRPQGVLLFDRESDGKAAVWRTNPNAAHPKASSLRLGMNARNPDWQPDCNLRGTNGPDRLVGTDRPQLICGVKGNDHIYGHGGGDRIFAGEGADTTDCYCRTNPASRPVTLATPGSATPCSSATCDRRPAATGWSSTSTGSPDPSLPSQRTRTRRQERTQR